MMSELRVTVTEHVPQRVGSFIVVVKRKKGKRKKRSFTVVLKPIPAKSVDTAPPAV